MKPVNLEQQALALDGLELPLMERVAISQAISLKRLADSQDQLVNSQAISLNHLANYQALLITALQDISTCIARSSK